MRKEVKCYHCDGIGSRVRLNHELFFNRTEEVPCDVCNGKGYKMVTWHVRRMLKRFGKSAVVYIKGRNNEI